MEKNFITMAGRETERMVPYLFTFVSLMVGAILYFYAPFWRVRQVPGPPTVPFLGHLPLIAKFGPDFFTALAKKYGPIFRYLFSFSHFPLI
jgi:carlactone C-19 oxidase